MHAKTDAAVRSQTPLFSDLALARRFELMEAAANSEAAEAAARRDSASGACWEAIAGGRAMFLGVGSIITQAFGVGTGGAVSDAEMDRLENFFRSRGSAVPLEICPLADKSLFEHLGKRGYRPIELSNVLARRVGGEVPAASKSGVQIARVMEADADEWCNAVAEGFFGPGFTMEIRQLMSGLCSGENSGAHLARIDGVAAGGGAFSIREGVMIFYGDATIDAYRGRGVQSALIAVRMADAAKAGCELLMAVTECGSISQRNYERAGFQVMYTRTKYLREWT